MSEQKKPILMEPDCFLGRSESGAVVGHFSSSGEPWKDAGPVLARPIVGGGANIHDGDYQRIRSAFIPLYVQQIGENLKASIGQCREGEEISQWLALLLERTDHDQGRQFILIRLSNVRKLFDFIDKKGFSVARRLKLWEKLRLDLKWKRTRTRP